MATPSFRQRAGLVEIMNKKRKIDEELKARKEKEEKEIISEEEHKKRLEKLKEMGLIK